jgi:hypothetical protein
MNQPIVFISGSKGGVGKSITTMAVLDYLSTDHRYVRLHDADNTNPDVWKAYSRSVESEVVPLDTVEGWIHLINTCDASSFKTVVVNTPARNNDSVRLHGQILLDALKELARPLITLWVINRQRDSLELLKQYLDYMPGGVVHVIRNGYFGEEHKYELFAQSALRESILQSGGKDLFLPDLADRVTDELYTRRITLAEAAAQLKLGDRVELARWRNSVREMMVAMGI